MKNPENGAEPGGTTPLHGRTGMRTKHFLAGISAFCALAGTPALAQDKPYEGVTVNVMTFTGPQIAEPLQRRA